MLSVFSDKLDLKGSALSPFRARWTAGKQPYPNYSSNLNYSTQNLATEAASEQEPECSEFYCSSKGRMFWKQELLNTRRWPFPSHNLSSFPPQHQKHYRKLKPSYAANCGPGFWEAEQQPLSKPTLICCSREGIYCHSIPTSNSFSSLCPCDTSVKQLRTASPCLNGGNSTKKRPCPHVSI